MPSTNNITTTKKWPDQLISTSLLHSVAIGCCIRLFQRLVANHFQQPRLSTNNLNNINMFICLKKKEEDETLYTQRWKSAMSGGRCPSLVPQKWTWDNASGHAVTWELQGTPAGKGAVRGGGCWDTYPVGRDAHVHGETMGSKEHMPWNKPIQRVRVREPVYLSIYLVPGWVLLPGLVNFLAFQAWPLDLWAEPAVCCGLETQGAETGRLLTAGTDWTVWGIWLQHWEPLPWWVQTASSLTLSS